MNGLALFLGRFRAMLTDLWSLGIFALAVIISALIALNADETADATTTVALVNEDEGEFGDQLIRILQADKDYNFRLVSYEDAVRMTARSQAHSMFVITTDFTEKIKNRDFDSLIQARVMQDSPSINTITELIINSVVKVWIAEIARNDLKEVASAGDAELASFDEECKLLWQGESLLVIETEEVQGTTAIKNAGRKYEAEANPGFRWYAVLLFFYLLLSGTWMMEYGRSGVSARIRQKGYSISAVFLWQSLPGLIIGTIGYATVGLIAGELPGGVSFVIYILGIMGISLIVCSVCKDFNTLLFVAPMTGLAVSLVSGLIVRLPEWAEIWNVVSMVFPGHWYNAALSGDGNILLGAVVSLIWLLIGVVLINVRRH